MKDDIQYIYQKAELLSKNNAMKTPEGQAEEWAISESLHPDTYGCKIRKEGWLAGYAAAREWHPIETADKTKNLIITDGNNVGEARYIGDPKLNYFREAGWFWLDDNVLVELPIKATGWQLLPEPPKE
jgi:hypothetical protein